MSDAVPTPGSTTFDIYLNGDAFWRNVPATVGRYRFGDYQVLKKWLSYRERTIFDRSLRAEEVQPLHRHGAAHQRSAVHVDSKDRRMNENTTCAIWDTPATETPVDRDGRAIDSPRAGGKYFVSGTVDAALKERDKHLKVRLTTWLVEQRELGNSSPEITSLTIDDAKQWKDSPVFDRADSILKYLASRSETLGTQIDYRVSIGGFFVAPLDILGKTYFELLAHSGCISSEEFLFLLDYLVRRGLIERSGINNAEQACTLTVDGHARLAELENIYTASSRAFVAMWFDSSMQAARDDGIKPAIINAGYEPILIDEKEHIDRIDDEIISEIRRSRFLVADFTQDDKGARGGVYYEAGFAHGRGIPVIFSCRRDKVPELHFDTRQYNHIVWDTPDDLRNQLTNRISAAIGDGPYKPAD